MNFMEAVKIMKEGKKVIRKEWKEINFANDYCRIYESKIIQRFNFEYKRYEQYFPNLFNFEATDWEIYEEKDNWNLAEQKDICGGCSCYNIHNLRESDIKTFLSKTKEKIKKGVDPIQALDETAGDL